MVTAGLSKSSATPKASDQGTTIMADLPSGATEGPMSVAASSLQRPSKVSFYSCILT